MNNKPIFLKVDGSLRVFHGEICRAVPCYARFELTRLHWYKKQSIWTHNYSLSLPYIGLVQFTWLQVEPQPLFPDNLSPWLTTKLTILGLGQVSPADRPLTSWENCSNYQISPETPLCYGQCTTVKCHINCKILQRDSMGINLNFYPDTKRVALLLTPHYYASSTPTVTLLLILIFLGFRRF